MEKEQEYKYMKMALALCNIVASVDTCEMVCKCHDKLKEKGEEFSLKDAAKIQSEIEERIKNKEIEKQSQTKQQ